MGGTPGIFLESSREAARREISARIECLLHFLHERKILARGAPGVDFALELERAPGNRGAGLPPIRARIQHRGAGLLELRHGSEIVFRWKQSDISDADAAKGLDNLQREFVRDAVASLA